VSKVFNGKTTTLLHFLDSLFQQQRQMRDASSGILHIMLSYTPKCSQWSLSFAFPHQNPTSIYILPNRVISLFKYLSKYESFGDSTHRNTGRNEWTSNVLAVILAGYIYLYSIWFDAIRKRTGFAAITSYSQREKHRSNGCLNTGVLKFPQSVYVSPRKRLEKLLAKNLKICTKSAHALLNNFKNQKTEPPCLSSTLIQNFKRSSTSLVIITDSEATGTDSARPPICFTLQNNCITKQIVF
jgi:hypothetical protein